MIIKKKIIKSKFTNSLLLTSLIESDFFLYKNSSFLKSITIFKITFLSKQNFLSFLNPIFFLKNIKQYIRLIQFFRLQSKKNSFFNFFTENLYQKDIIKKFISLNKIELNFNTTYNYLLVNKAKTLRNKKLIFRFQMLLVLGRNIFKNLNTYKYLLNKRIYLIQEINLLENSKNIGIFKLFSSVKDYKKLIFLLSILGQILKFNVYNKTSHLSLQKINIK